MTARTARANSYQRPLQALTVAGIMSGTSADGIDVALVRIQPTEPKKFSERAPFPQTKLLAHLAVPYSPAVRKRVLQVMNAPAESVADLSRLHWRLGQLYADAVQEAMRKFSLQLDLIGCHGQTIYHQANAKNYLGANIACTWQIGEPSVIAAKLGIPVVSDFRTADLATGGQGAPLVPLLDYVVFRKSNRNRVLQNLGGIGNLTVIPAGAVPENVFAFDTGPGNMVIDAIATELLQKKYDAHGAMAARGHVLSPVIDKNLAQRFFKTAPPKSAGREEFGREFVARFLADCRSRSSRTEDALATATALTARSIGLAWKRFVQPALVDAPTDYIMTGGGAYNRTLLKMIESELSALGKICVRTSEEFGVPSSAKEAMAFALLAYQTWHGLPGNIPSATGAQRSVVLGKISYA